MLESIIDQVISRARALAKEHGFSVCISVVDASGLQAGFFRMDDAIPGSIDVAIKKARTAALFRTNSEVIGAGAQPGGPIYSLEATNGGLISFGGGVVIRDSAGKVIGAIGVSGATVEGDQVIASGAVAL